MLSLSNITTYITNVWLRHSLCTYYYISCQTILIFVFFLYVVHEQRYSLIEKVDSSIRLSAVSVLIQYRNLQWIVCYHTVLKLVVFRHKFCCYLIVLIHKSEWSAKPYKCMFREYILGFLFNFYLIVYISVYTST